MDSIGVISNHSMEKDSKSFVFSLESFPRVFERREDQVCDFCVGVLTVKGEEARRRLSYQDSYHIILGTLLLFFNAYTQAKVRWI